MKRILFAVTMLVLLPGLRQAKADVSLSLDFFYDNLGSDGSWVQLGDYGYCWQPAVAVSNAKWRPYADGYWSYTNLGWTWISYEDFGWATYHYGRWARLRDRGWFWVPGREWGPAWVSWRTGGDYVGWAPLPPHTGEEVIDSSSPITGQVDLVYDIGPAYYNFIDVRYIGEPVLRDRIVEPSLNVTYIANTVNVTNITYANSMVYNYGPDYNVVSRYSARAIPRLTVQLNRNADPSAAVKSNEAVKVQGDKMMVTAPPVLQKPSAQVAPKAVKEKIEKPVVERGWKEIGDPKKEAELKQKMKTEDPKKAPLPDISPREGAEPAQKEARGGAPVAPPSGTAPANNVPATSAPPAASPGRGKDNRFPNASLGATTAPAKPVPTPAGKSKKERAAKPTPGQNPPSSTSVDGAPNREAPTRDTETKKGKHPEKGEPNEAAPEKEKRKPRDEAPQTAPPKRESAPESPKRGPSQERTAPPNHEAPPEASGKHQAPPQHAAPPSSGGNAPKSEAPHKKGEEKKGNQPAPTPGQ